MPLPLVVAVNAAKLAGDASRLLGRGSGSTLPGVVATRFTPTVAADLARQLTAGAIVVSGTNGKTTTSRMLATMLRYDRRLLVHNRAGANLMSGLTAALVTDCAPWGRLRSDTGLFEVDEATLSRALADLSPRVVVLLNLFRDQLDRYGELNSLATAWKRSLAAMPATTRLLLNADDPLIARLGEDVICSVDYFGIDDATAGIGRAEHTADSAFCRCGARLTYERVYYGHLGQYVCHGCGWQRPRPAISATAITDAGVDGTTAQFLVDGMPRSVRIRLPGLYNVYNTLAAVAAATRFGTSPPAVWSGIDRFRAAFGRLERIDAGGRELVLWLVKNPTGFNESLRTLLTTPLPKPLAIFINDNVADGHDVSWLWDVDVELLAVRQAELPWILVGGQRAHDMAVRLKYAGIDTARLRIEPHWPAAIHSLRAEPPRGLPVYCFPTYTAMLTLRGHLERAGWVTALRDD